MTQRSPPTKGSRIGRSWTAVAIVASLLAVAALAFGVLTNAQPWASNADGTAAATQTAEVTDTALLPATVETEAATNPTILINDVALIDTSAASEVLANESGDSGANFIAATVDEPTAAPSRMTGDVVTTTGIGDRFTSATASVLNTGMVLDGALPLPTSALTAIVITTFFALWYVYRRTCDGPNTGTILNELTFGRVPQPPTLGTGTFIRGNSPLLA